MDISDSITKLWENYGQIVLGVGRRVIIAALIFIAGKIVINLSRRLTHRAVTGKMHADETFA